MKKFYVMIALATIMVSLTVGNTYAQEEPPAPSVVGMTYRTVIQAGGDQSFATMAFSKTGVLSIAGWNGFGIYIPAGSTFVGVFWGIDVAFPGYKGNCFILYVGAATTANTLAGFGYVFQENVGDYKSKNFPFIFTGTF